MDFQLDDDDATKLVLECVQYALEPDRNLNNIESNLECNSPLNYETLNSVINRSNQKINLNRQYFGQFNYDEYDQQVIYNAQFSNLQQNRKFRRCCNFCRKNGERAEFYYSHSLYKNGYITCPILQHCICKLCGAKGHTLSHCPKQKNRDVLRLIHQFNSSY